jgi:D-3-phosphoglycerate dehydrogenase
VAEKLIRFINNGSTTGAVNVPQVELPEQGGAHDDGTNGAEAVGGVGAGNGQSARRHRILHFHKNVPGVLSKMHAIISELGANIAAEYLQTNAEVGYVVLDVDPTDAEAIVSRLRQIPETIRLRMLW